MTNYTKRLEKLGKKLAKGETVILFAGLSPESTSDSRYSLRTNKSFFYFTGLKAETYKVALYADESGVDYTLFIEKPNYDVEKWTGRRLTKEQAGKISGIKNVLYTEDFEAWLNSRIYNDKTKRIMLDIGRYSWNDRMRLEEEFAKIITEKYPHVSIGSVSGEIAKMREIKDAHEIEQLRKAIDITDAGIRKLYAVAKPGMYEYELAAEFAYEIGKRGETNSFETIAASGENGYILHHVENDRKMQDGDLVLMDLGSWYKEYAADISRTFPVNGKFTERQKQIYEIVLKAQEDVLKVMKPGTPFAEINKACRASLLKSMKKIGMVKNDEELWKYYYHGVSHPIGLDVHDVGVRGGVLKAGMVLSLEPGIYIAEENIGIRIEDDILITKTGNEVLSKQIPKSVADIERLMAAGAAGKIKKAPAKKKTNKK